MLICFPVTIELDARRKLVDDDIGSITRAHAKMFAEAFDTALRFIVEGFKAFDGVPGDKTHFYLLGCYS